MTCVVRQRSCPDVRIEEDSCMVDLRADGGMFNQFRE